VLLIGLGGIWVEAMGDLQVLPAEADKATIVEALHRLRAAKLLTGFRGAPCADVEAAAGVAMAIGRLMRTVPEIVEIDVNPLVVHAAGEGATAVDALIVVDKPVAR
jgi:acetate---CoA ligase (ADP-forming)